MHAWNPSAFLCVIETSFWPLLYWVHSFVSNKKHVSIKIQSHDKHGLGLNLRPVKSGRIKGRNVEQKDCHLSFLDPMLPWLNSMAFKPSEWAKILYCSFICTHIGKNLVGVGVGGGESTRIRDKGGWSEGKWPIVCF